jgi:hypothetical protein
VESLQTSLYKIEHQYSEGPPGGGAISLCERRNPALGHEDGASIVGPGLSPLPALQLRGGGLKGTFDPTLNKEITIGEGWLYQIEQALTEGGPPGGVPSGLRFHRFWAARDAAAAEQISPIRIDLRLKEAARKAAEMDQRSLSGLIERLLVGHCRKVGTREQGERK